MVLKRNPTDVDPVCVIHLNKLEQPMKPKAKRKPQPKRTYYVYEDVDGKEYVTDYRLAVYTRKIEAVSLISANKLINKK